MLEEKVAIIERPVGANRKKWLKSGFYPDNAAYKGLLKRTTPTLNLNLKQKLIGI